MIIQIHKAQNSQCPILGGIAVLKVRTLLHVSDTTEHIFPIDDCFEDSPHPKNTLTAESSASFTLYPNPVKDQLTLSYQISTSEKAILEVYDLKGAKVYQEVLSNEEAETKISVHGWTEGLYIFKITLNNKTYVAKKILVTK